MKKTTRNVILFDDNELRKHLMPFTYTRPAALLRIGITTISETWQAMLGEATYSYLTVKYLKKKFPYRGNVYGAGCGSDNYDSADSLSFNPKAGIVYTAPTGKAARRCCFPQS